MMKFSAANDLIRDLSKWSLMKPDGGGCNLTRWFEVVEEEEDPLKN